MISARACKSRKHVHERKRERSTEHERIVARLIKTAHAYVLYLCLCLESSNLGGRCADLGASGGRGGSAVLLVRFQSVVLCTQVLEPGKDECGAVQCRAIEALEGRFGRPLASGDQRVLHDLVVLVKVCHQLHGLTFR
jgi:hypothetical protein